MTEADIKEKYGGQKKEALKGKAPKAKPKAPAAPTVQGTVLICDTQAYGPLRAGPNEEDQDLDRYTFGEEVKSEKAYRVCWGLWDEDAGLWRNMRGDAVRPRSEWLRVKDVTEAGRYQHAPEGTHAEARFATLWRPEVTGL